MESLRSKVWRSEPALACIATLQCIQASAQRMQTIAQTPEDELDIKTARDCNRFYREWFRDELNFLYATPLWQEYASKCFPGKSNDEVFTHYFKR